MIAPTTTAVQNLAISHDGLLTSSFVLVLCLSEVFMEGLLLLAAALAVLPLAPPSDSIYDSAHSVVNLFVADEIA
jgi:hypothetical protein